MGSDYGSGSARFLRRGPALLSRRADALVVATVVVMIDEAGNLPLEIARQKVVFEQDAVLQRLVPALDLALGLGMAGCTARVIHAVVG